MASTALTRPLYRALLRGAAKAEAAGASAADLAALLPPGSAAPCGDARATVRAAFRTPGGSVDAALAALPKVNALVQQLKARAASPAAAATTATSPATATSVTSPAAPRFGCGTVMRHARHGYRGVVIGYDAGCRAAPEWVAATGCAALPHGLAQPFYYVLVDVRDRPGCQIAYVAQDLLAPLSASAAAGAEAPPAEKEGAAAGGGLQSRLVLHPLLTAYFSSFTVATGTFVPHEGVPMYTAATAAASAAAAARHAARHQPAADHHLSVAVAAQQVLIAEAASEGLERRPSAAAAAR